MSDHIVRSFDNELDELDRRIAEMGGLAESQLAEAMDALITRNADRSEAIVARDARLDDLEREVNHRALRLLALRQPMAADLRAAVAALKISGDLERIGDYAKNIAKRIAVATATSPEEPLRAIVRMGRLVQSMIKNVLDAYAARDAALATDVRDRDEEVDQLHGSVFRELLTYMMEDARNITACTHLLFMAKNIERIGDHATNIAEHVIFLIEGETPGGERPKDDAANVTQVTLDRGR